MSDLCFNFWFRLKSKLDNLCVEVRLAAVAAVSSTSQALSSLAVVPKTSEKPDNKTVNVCSNIKCIRKAV